MQLKDILLYEDKDMLAINKPVGLLVHGDGKKVQETLVDLLVAAYPEIKNITDGGSLEDDIVKEKKDDDFEIEDESAPQIAPVVLFRPGIVHRLDRDTSGVMLVGKTQLGFDILKKQFQKRTIKKTYTAIVAGWLADEVGLIDAPIGRSATDIRQWTASRGARGELRESRTRYRVIKKGGDVVDEHGHIPAEHRYSVVEVYPETGRTHQIRVHFKFINRPLIGDMVYARSHAKDLGISRVALHATKITFKASSGEEKTVLAPFPEDFLAAEAKIVAFQ